MGTLVSSANKPDGHDTDEQLLKVVLNTISLTLIISLFVIDLVGFITCSKFQIDPLNYSS